VERIEFRIHVGRCGRCRRRVQRRHPRQTSDRMPLAVRPRNWAPEPWRWPPSLIKVWGSRTVRPPRCSSKPSDCR
jgi:hypothetical protein